MKKHRLKLNELNVKSFTTSETKVIKAGKTDDMTVYTDGYSHCTTQK
ncbi:MAG: pinensin family lanthipeptide [Bacteroidota bacterium]